MLRYLTYTVATIAVVVLAVLAALSLRSDNTGATRSPAAAASATSTVAASPNSTVAAGTATASAAPAAPTATRATGTITGRLGYPSDFVPPLTIFAISVADAKNWSSTETPRFGNPTSQTPPPGGPTWPPEGPGTYRIAGIAPGTYYVIAYRNDNSPGVGVYTYHTVNCLQASQGGQASTPAPGCAANDHRLLPVTVGAGATVTRIDVIDWVFDQRGDYPARPR